MRNYFLILLAISPFLVSCSKESGSITGSWVRAMDGQPQHQHGFTLKAEGSAASINMPDKVYEKWVKFGDKLILSGTSKNTENNSTFSDTLKIVSVNDSMMVLKESNGKTIGYTKTNAPEKVISNFETYDCYVYITSRDTATMRINVADNLVTGNLEYHIFEKDRNTGTIRGKMTGDTLLADYTFQSEGTTSGREIVMVKKGGEFTEGYGEVGEKDGKVNFVNRKKLKFEKGMTFRKTNCN
jgi:hypothetical protein